MNKKINQYLKTWSSQGYSVDIPDEVPDELMRQKLAPSYKAIALCILKNDNLLTGLGFTGTPTPWYGELKRIEIEARGETRPQMEMGLSL